MTGIPDSARPYFFFSYSRSDATDPLLDKFLDRLNTQVALLAGCGGEMLYYRDTAAPLSDGRWQPELLNALKEECNVLLALYTPGYFKQKANEKCYCGRELSLFLRRTNGNHVNIIPVLWLINEPPPEDMVPPPLHFLDWYICRDPRFTLPQAKIQQYMRRGLQSLWANSPSGQRNKIIDDLARRIYQWAQTPPDPLTGPVNMAAEDCAFHPGETAHRKLSSVGDVSPAQTSDGRALTLVYVDEDRVPDETQDLIERVGQDLGNFMEVRTWSVSSGVNVLRDAAKKNPAIILAVQSAALAPGGVTRAALESLTGHGDWIGGILQLGSDAGLAPAPTVPVLAAQVSEQEIRRQLGSLVADVRSALARLATPVTTLPAGRPVPRF
jgi:hypothetical protein